MTEQKEPNGQNKLHEQTIEQLELTNQVLEKAKQQVEEAQNIVQETKEALVQQDDGKP